MTYMKWASGVSRDKFYLYFFVVGSIAVTKMVASSEDFFDDV